jgi:hypothetical protein
MRKDRTATFVRLSSETHTAIKEAARAELRSLSAEVELACRRYLEARNEKGRPREAAR